MKIRRIILVAALTSILSSTPYAGPRTSANYTIPAEAIDRGGRATNSTSYHGSGSAGLIAGKASSAGSVVTINAGYVAQIASSNIPVQVVSAVSRKVHGASQTFDIPLPLSGPPGIECRTVGAGGSHQVIVTFTTPVTVAGVSVMSADGMAAGSSTVNGATATINLTAVANAQTLGITLTNVSNGSTAGNIFIPMGVLAGDTTGNGFVTASDIGQVKAQSGQAATSANFRTDANASGAISSSDIGLVKSRTGTQLP